MTNVGWCASAHVRFFFVKTLQNELLISTRLVKIIVNNLCGEGPVQRLLEPTSDSQSEDKMVLGDYDKTFKYHQNDENAIVKTMCEIFFINCQLPGSTTFEQ